MYVELDFNFLHKGRLMHLFPYNGIWYGTIRTKDGRVIDGSSNSFMNLYKQLLIKAGVK